MNNLYFILIGGLIGAVSGYIGSFMVIKRMSLVGDALSHVALPGIAIALMIGINPMLGAFIALAISIFGIWYLGEKTSIYSESLVGVFFTLSLAIGILITPEPEIFESLFGDIDNITKVDSLFIILGAFLIFIILYKISKQLMLTIVSEDLAKSQMVNVSKINLIYLLLVGVVVSLGVKFLGTLLTGALVIIPAVTAKNISLSSKKYQILSIFFGFVSSALGIILAKNFEVSSGPVVVLVASFIYITSSIYFIASKNK